jgi:hypothetical protein
VTNKEQKVQHKKTVILVASLAMLLAATLLLVAGCGSSTTSSGSSGGLTEASAGAPIYPGATKADISQMRAGNGSGYRFRPQGSTPQGSTPQGSTPRWRGQGSVPNGQSGRSTTALWTKDSTDKVAAWYKDKLSGKKSFSQMNMPNFSGQTSNATTYRFASGDSTVMVMIRPALQQKGGTTIMISKGTGQFPGSPGFNSNSGQSPNQNPSQSPNQTF